MKQEQVKVGKGPQGHQKMERDYITWGVLGGLVVSVIVMSIISHGLEMELLQLGWIKLIGVLVCGGVGFYFQTCHTSSNH